MAEWINMTSWNVAVRVQIAMIRQWFSEDGFVVRMGAKRCFGNDYYKSTACEATSASMHQWSAHYGLTVWWPCVPCAPMLPHSINSNSVFLLLLFFSLGKKKVKKVENEPKSESMHRDKLEEKGKGWWKNTFFTQTHCWNEVMIYGFSIGFSIGWYFLTQ